MTGRTLYGMPWRGNKQTKAEKELESSDLEPVPLSSIRILESGSPGLRLLDQVLLHFSASRKFTAASGTLSRFLLFAVPPFCCLFAAAENFISWRIFHRILGCMRGEGEKSSCFPGCRWGVGTEIAFSSLGKNQSQLVGSTCALYSEHFTQWLIAILVKGKANRGKEMSMVRTCRDLKQVQSLAWEYVQKGAAEN